MGKQFQLVRYSIQSLNSLEINKTGSVGKLHSVASHLGLYIRARKLYTSARIYEWNFGKGEWKLPFARPTGRVDFLGCL